jgi:hypothetical protein
MKHTKGEWKSTFGLRKNRGVRNEGGFICFLITPSRYTGQDERYEKEMEEYKANAKLIAKSPVMYDYITKKAKEGCEDAKYILATLK